MIIIIIAIALHIMCDVIFYFQDVRFAVLEGFLYFLDPTVYNFFFTILS